MKPNELNVTVPANRIHEYLPHGHKPHLVTVYRWINRGVRGVKLKTMRIGGVRYTTPLWIADFLVQLNASDTDAHTTSVGRERQTAQAEKQLVANGW